ncbi:glycosyltransferase family 4 protein [Sphaerotilaceae bacterium SBD11-9]
MYFDITDIVRYATSNDRVAGIPRVHFNLIAHLSRKHGGDAVRCVFHHSTQRGMVEFDPSAMFSSDEFDASTLLQRLGLEQPHRIFPRRRTIKNYLRRYDSNKPLRALKKLDVHLSALLMPRRLSAMGLSRPMWAEPFTLRELQALPRDARYVLLSIDNQQALEFARIHREAGGDVVQMMYDLIPHTCPELFERERISEFTAWLDKVVALRPRAMCISEWTARDLRQYIGEAANRWDIDVVPLAHELDGFERNARVPMPENARARLPQGPFVLCVGTLENRKNGLTLLRAWEKVLGALGESAPDLVFAGRYGWHIEEFLALLKTPRLSRKVRVIESPSDHDLAWLYGNCLFTAYPSLYEGWGLPVGESAWFGKYCVASRASSLPEVCGDLIDYIDPRDASDLAGKIVAALSDPAYVARREEAIRAAPLRRWTDVADHVFSSVTQVPGSPVAAGAAPGKVMT